MSQVQLNYDPNAPFPLEVGGHSPQGVRNHKQRTGMARWHREQKCRQCGELLRRKGGLTPQGNSLGWLLRGYGPFCLTCNVEAWWAWKKGLFHGMTDNSGY